MKLDGVRSGLGRFLEAIVLVLMMTLALVVVLGVVYRKAGASLVWYDEVASILLAWLTYYGAAYAALKRAHIAVPTLVDKLPGRARVAAILAAEVAVIAFFAALAFAGFRVLTVLSGTTLVSLPWMPMSVAQSVIPIGAILFIAAQLLSLPAVLAAATSPGGAAAPGGVDAAGPGDSVAGTSPFPEPDDGDDGTSGTGGGER